MTDFSDRLDSLVDGLIAEIHDRVNLLLIVGIAGTMFGVFEFAIRFFEDFVATHTAPTILNLSVYLSESMSKAFPVGVMGLALTLIFQIASALPENKLRGALSEATQRALQKRQESSISQAQIVKEAVDKIDAAMSPLADLKKVLSESIQPVVKEFGDRLDKSLELATKQFEQLNSGTQAIQQSTAALETSANNLVQLVKDAPTVIKNLLDLQEQQRQALSTLQDNYRTLLDNANGIAVSLNAAVNRFGSLPEDITHKIEESVSGLSTAALEIWKKRTDEFVQSFQAEYIRLLTEIKQSSDAIKKSMEEYSVEIRRLAQESRTLLETKFIEAVNNILLAKYPEAIKLVESLNSSLGHVVSDFKDAQQTLEQWLIELKASASRIEIIHQELAALVTTVRQLELPSDGQMIVSKLTEANRLLKRLCDHTPTIAIVDRLTRTKTTDR